jgi:hypothetical protein
VKARQFTDMLGYPQQVPRLNRNAAEYACALEGFGMKRTRIVPIGKPLLWRLVDWIARMLGSKQ